MIGIDELVNFLLDGACIERNVVFGEELLFFIVIEFVIANGADFGLFAFFGSQQFGEFLLLSDECCTSFLSRF